MSKIKFWRLTIYKTPNIFRYFMTQFETSWCVLTQIQWRHMPSLCTFLHRIVLTVFLQIDKFLLWLTKYVIAHRRNIFPEEIWICALIFKIVQILFPEPRIAMLPQIAKKKNLTSDLSSHVLRLGTCLVQLRVAG